MRTFLMLLALGFGFGAVMVVVQQPVAQADTSNRVTNNLQAVLAGPASVRADALQWLKQRNKTDVVAALIAAARYVRDSEQIYATLQSLTGAELEDSWHAWVLWQQAHPEIQPFEGFDGFQSLLFSSIDPNFQIFLHIGVKHEIRLEEIVWGGVRKDGIPALTNPKLIAASQADFMSDDEPVFGIEINGDVRAYPYRMMDWHEMFNDVIGGVPVSLAYCTLCGAGILFDTRVEGRKEPFVFGSSGFLYRSNKLMYDQQTHSLWNQYTGRPVVGELTGSGIELKVLPVVTTSWGEWRRQHADTKVLSLETGFTRDYTPGRPYGTYFASDKLMFPALVEDKRLAPKDQVFALRISGSDKAWPLTVFAGGRVINDHAGVVQLVLIGDEHSRTVRAYRSNGRTFSKGANPQQVLSQGATWRVTEIALEGPNGEKLSRLPGHLVYWFAWRGYVQTPHLYTEP